MAFRPPNWDEIIDKDDDNDSRSDHGAPRRGSSRHTDGNDSDNGDGEEEKQGDENGTWKEKGTHNQTGIGKGKGKGMLKAMEEGKGKGKGNSKGKGIVKQTPGGDDITRLIALQLQNEMYEAESDMEG